MLAFGSDSFVEILSAVIVLLQWSPRVSISERRAARGTSVWLFALAFVVAAAAIAFLLLKLRPETSRAGIAITVAALIVMPILASLKRREARRCSNAALAADAVQSATCAYLAGVTFGWPCRERPVPCRLVRSAGRTCSRSHSHQRGAVGMEMTNLRLLLTI